MSSDELETEHPAEEPQLAFERPHDVRRIAEAVPFVGEGERRIGQAVGLHRLDDQIRLVGWDDLVLGALEDRYGAVQPAEVVDRRALPVDGRVLRPGPTSESR